MSVVKQLVPCLTSLKQLVYYGFLSLLRFDGTINRRIHNFLDVKSPALTMKLVTPTTLVSISDVPIQPSRDLWFRLFVTASSGGRLPFILYFHGGGFCMLGPDSVVYSGCGSLLAAETQAVIASVNYRLSPEHRYPCQYEDAFDALKFINSHNYSVVPANTDLDRCFIAGDSAGANIVHHVTVRAFQNSHELKMRRPEAIDLKPFGGVHIMYKERSKARFVTGDIIGALEDAKEALTLAPYYPEAYICEGDVLMAMDRFNEAEESYSIGLELDPSIRRSKSFKARIAKLREKQTSANTS